MSSYLNLGTQVDECACVGRTKEVCVGVERDRDKEGGDQEREVKMVKQVKKSER